MKRIAFAVVLLVLGGMVASGVVWAQGSQINACVERSTGYLKLGTCAGSPLSWSVQGPQGPAGPAGPQGPVGPAGPPGVAASGLMPKQVIYKNSAIDKASAHTVTVRCPGDALALYGGAGLISPGKADAALLRVSYSRPLAVQAVPKGWSAGARRIDYDPRLALTLLDLTVAARSQMVAHHLYVHTDDPPEFYADEAQQWSSATPGRWAKAIARAEEAIVAPAPKVWGVQAWVVCGE
jgi:hypothetical protein